VIPTSKPGLNLLHNVVDNHLPILQRPGGTYALYCHIIRKDGAWEVQQPFAISESFKPEDGSIYPLHLLHGDIQSAVHSCIGTLNGDTNRQPHRIKWAFREAYRIRMDRCYGFIVECLVTKRAVLQHSAQAGKPLVSGQCAFYPILTDLFEIIEMFKPTPTMLVQILILPGEFRIQNKLPISSASQTSDLISPWTKHPIQYITAVGLVTAVVNNSEPDLTKHAWGLKGLFFDTERLHAVLEWQHAGVVHTPPQASVPSAPPPMSV
jgi:hypothetical protein